MRQKLFIICAMLMMMTPLLGLPVSRSDLSTENRTLAEMPQLIKEGHFNLQVLADAGAWFEDHFAFRPALVQTGSTVLEKMLHTSSSDQVVLGKDNWLYFSGTLDDYTGESLLNERERFNIVHNLSLIQHYLNSRGCKMLVAIAPNKNSIYEEYMPERYFRSDRSNLDLIQEDFKEAGISYADLKEALRAQKEDSKEDLYFKTDSHWNHAGAKIGWQVIQQAMDLPDIYEDLEGTESLAKESGDLVVMLYPLDETKEADLDYGLSGQYEWKQGGHDLMAERIITHSAAGQGNLLMMRDSFAKALLDFAAVQYENTLLDRKTPYNLMQIENIKGSDVILEKVERRIGEFQQEAAVIKMPVIENPEVIERKDSWLDPEIKAELQIHQDGDFLRIEGEVHTDLLTGDNLYLQLQTASGNLYTYPVFYVNENGYQVFLETALLQSQAGMFSLLLQKENQFVRLTSMDYDSAAA